MMRFRGDSLSGVYTVRLSFQVGLKHKSVGLVEFGLSWVRSRVGMDWVWVCVIWGWVCALISVILWYWVLVWFILFMLIYTD